MDKAALKAKVREAIRARRADIERLAEAIFDEPELGFKEVKTSAKVKTEFDKLGITYTDGWAITGVKARMKGGKGSKKTVALLGELDAIICKSHPASDAETGAAHCCGHNIQIANLLGVAMAFKDTGVMEELAGDVVFFAVPAEEYVELTWRNTLRKAGKLHFIGGKAELIYEGAFDDVDLAMMMHANVKHTEQAFYDAGGSSNGFVGKNVRYVGRAAHAAGHPDAGINALNAACLGIMGVNAIRERFREADYVRFHPIIASGGDLVNVIPDNVTMESYVRAANVEALKRYSEDINAALTAGASAIGAKCEIDDIPGYLPLQPDQALRDILVANAKTYFGEEGVGVGPHNTASTDMGDISHLMPTVHPWVECVTGVLHGADFKLVDRDTAFEKSICTLADTIIDLLADDAQAAESICANFKPVFDRESYTAFWDGFVAK